MARRGAAPEFGRTSPDRQTFVLKLAGRREAWRWHANNGIATNARLSATAPTRRIPSPNDLRLSGERPPEGRTRVRCSRGFGESWLMRRNITRRYAFAEMQFNVSGLAPPETVETQGPALLRSDLGRRRPGRNECTMRVRARPRVVACPALHVFRESPNGLRLSGAEGVRCSRGFGGEHRKSRPA